MVFSKIKIISIIFIFISSILIVLNYTTASNEPKPKKVAFIVHTSTVGGKGVPEIYAEMKKIGHDVKIVILPLFYTGVKLKEEIDLDFAKLFDKDDVIFPCGLKEPYTCNNIDQEKFDYIFTQTPYNPYENSPLNPYFTNSNLKKICKKLMLIVYGPHIFHQLGMNNPNLAKDVDVVLVDSYTSQDIYVESFGFTKENVVVSGYQPYKTIRDHKSQVNPNKSQNETLLWLPRWQLSFRDRELYEGGSTFLNYHYYFYNYCAENPSINLIVRPHYGLFLLRSKFLQNSDLMGILNRLDSLDNISISLHQEASLDEDILKADVIISDGSSALAEAIIADKPIIYLSNGWNNEFNSNILSRELKNQIYIAYDPLDIEKYLEIIRSNKYKITYDDKYKKMLDPVENPAKFIAEYILNL